MREYDAANLDHSAPGYSPIAEYDFRLWLHSRRLS